MKKCKKDVKNQKLYELQHILLRGVYKPRSNFNKTPYFVFLVKINDLSCLQFLSGQLVLKVGVYIENYSFMRFLWNALYVNSIAWGGIRI